MPELEGNSQFMQSRAGNIVFLIYNMSSSESDFDDEDLSAPPKRPKLKEDSRKNGVVVAATAAERDVADDAAGEDVRELSPGEYRIWSVKRKQDSVSPKVDKYSPIVRRQALQGTARTKQLLILDGEKVVWSEGEEPKQPRTWPLPPPKRRKKASTTTGVGRRQRRGAQVPNRPKNHTLNLGNRLSGTKKLTFSLQFRLRIRSPSSK